MQRPRITTPQLLFLFLVLGIGLPILDSLRLLEPIKDGASQIIAPIARAFESLGSGFAGLGDYLRDQEILRQENEELQRLVDQLTIENVQLQEAAIENQELRRLLSFKEANPELTLVAAEIIGRDPSSLIQNLVVDQGSEEGIQIGMPVVTDRGLIGQIFEVYPHSSRVLLIIDPTSSITARIQSSRATGLVSGTPQAGLVMQLIPQQARLQVGDIVITAGLGDRFPRGLVIGQVTEVQRSDVQVFQEASVQPSVDFNLLERVLIVINFPKEETAS